MALLRRLWSEAILTCDGPDERFERAGLGVLPREPIPIWFGGGTEAAFRRAGSTGDGFHFVMRPKIDLATQWARVRRYLDEAGRREDTFGRNLLVGMPTPDPQAAADELKRWRDAGHTHGTIQSLWFGFQSPEQHLEYFHRVAERYRA